MNKGIRFRVYPTKQQKELIAKTFGCVRLIYNKGLSAREEAYTNGRPISYAQTSAMLTTLKKEDEYAFLQEVDSIALQQSLRDLDKAFVNFFSKRNKYPKYKSKKNHFRSYRTQNVNNKIRIVGNRIKLPKLGYVKTKQSMPVGKIHNATVEQVPSGKYYVILNVDFEPRQMPKTENVIGIDVGIKNFCTDSNGKTTPNPKHLEKAQKQLMKEQRRLSRIVEGSHHWNKQRIKVAQLYERVANQRNDFLQKLTTALIRENKVICVEDLRVRNMLKNHKLALSISSASWSAFFTMLEYKAEWYGRTVVKVPTFYPSSQTCDVCGYKNADIKALKIRKWTCPICGTIHDRDGNAATNILNKGMAMLAEQAVA